MNSVFADADRVSESPVVRFHPAFPVVPRKPVCWPRRRHRLCPYHSEVSSTYEPTAQCQVDRPPELLVTCSHRLLRFSVLLLSEPQAAAGVSQGFRLVLFYQVSGLVNHVIVEVEDLKMTVV